MTLIASFAVILALILFYICFGHLFLRRICSFNIEDPLIRFTARFYMGVGLWFYVTSLLSLYGYFKLRVVTSIFICVILAGLFFVRQDFAAFWKSFRVSFFESIPAQRRWKFIYALTVLLWLIGLASLFSPIEEDGAAFYMPIARTIASSGWMNKLPGYDEFSAVGLVGETQMATALLLDSSDFAARVLCWFIFSPIILILFKAKHIFKFSAEANVIQLLSVFSSLAIFCILYGGKVDLFSAALGFIGIYLLFFEKSVFVAGLLLALACVAKLSLFIPLFPIVVVGLIKQWLLVEDERKKHKISFLVSIFTQMAIAFVIVIIPHLLKNHIFFNNPFAPFYGGKIGWESTWYSAETVRRIMLTYPLVWFYGRYWGQLGTMAIPMLMFAPLAMNKKIFNKNNLAVALYFLSAFLGMAFWFFIRPSFVAPRYILAVLLMFVPLAAIGFDQFIFQNAQARVKKNILVFILVVWSFHSLSVAKNYGLNPSKAIIFFKNMSNVCVLDGDNCEIFQALNAKALPGERVLQLTYYTYWLRSDLLQTMRKVDDFPLYTKTPSEELWKLIYAKDFKYIVINKITHGADIDNFYLNNPPSGVILKKISEVGKLVAYEIEYDNSFDGIKKTVSIDHEDNHWLVNNL